MSEDGLAHLRESARYVCYTYFVSQCNNGTNLWTKDISKEMTNVCIVFEKLGPVVTL